MKVVRVISLAKWPRAAVARKVSESYGSKVHVTLHAELDVLKIKELKEKLLPIVEEKFGTRLTYTGIFTKLLSSVLIEHLNFNSVVEKDEAKVMDGINISVLVQSEKLGLVTPVVRNVDRKSLGQTSLELNRIVENARKGNVHISDLTGGTFTLSNIGMLGSTDAFTQIINPPQTAILGVGRIIEKPVAIDGQIQVRPVCTFSLTFDHRVVDGYHGAEFLMTWKKMIEYPKFDVDNA